ncbi:hypothetical protein N8I77_006388 [Diaporthe amygdali]|uniref:Uncharacterized protein n=1 Tax=Phomopsis amygdali TaxID=1214568 RepID=A0AAD9SGX0_PHOAM|nr:hypothetical protein N8I77_006388 [Diaporthe amygdali]
MRASVQQASNPSSFDLSSVRVQDALPLSFHELSYRRLCALIFDLALFCARHSERSLTTSVVCLDRSVDTIAAQRDSGQYDMWQLPTSTKFSPFRLPRDEQTQTASPARLPPVPGEEHWTGLKL